MENAGRAVAAEAIKMVSPGARIAVLCGPGNNGGDGFVAARVLREAGYAVSIAPLAEPDKLRGDAAVMAAKADHLDRVDIWTLNLSGCDLVIDALFGAGLSRPMAPEIGDKIFGRLFGGPPILAVDVPSGLDGTTGQSTGFVLSATRTVTFFRLKPGHLLMPGRALCGRMVLADIGMPDGVLAHIPGPLPHANAPATWLPAFPRLAMDGHKYSRGHAVVVSGGIEMSGAARLCARGALRIGAGLVTVATPPDALLAHAAQLNATLLKAASTPGELRQLLADSRFTAVAVGPGLGRAADVMERVLAVLDCHAATVLDADALTVAADNPARLFEAIQARPERPAVLTPHDGEFNRLFPDLSGSKLERARQAASRSGAVVVLKGPDTVIAAPDGRASINDNAPPTLATAGSGDVLAGFVTGLLAQRMPAYEAACAAVWVHGAAAERFGRGLIAEDLPETLPGVLTELLGGLR
jgi:NAD(P)H-hydrate epimerase